MASEQSPPLARVTRWFFKLKIRMYNHCLQLIEQTGDRILQLIFHSIIEFKWGSKLAVVPGHAKCRLFTPSRPPLMDNFVAGT